MGKTKTVRRKKSKVKEVKPEIPKVVSETPDSTSFYPVGKKPKN